MKKLYEWNQKTVVGLAFLLCASAVGTFIPYELQRFINGESTRQSITLSLVIGLFLAQAITQVVGQYILAIYAEEQIVRLRNLVSKRLLHAKASYIDTLNSGEVSSRVVNDTNVLKRYLVGSLPQFISGLVTIVLSLIFLILLDWKLTLVLFTVLPVMALITIPLSNVNARFAAGIQEKTSILTATIGETMQEMYTIKVNHMEEAQERRVEEAVTQLKQETLKNDRMDAITTPVAMMVIFSAIAIIFVYGGMRVNNGSLSVGVLVSFLMYLFQLLNPISSITEFGVNRAKMQASLSEIATLLEAPSERTEGVSLVQPANLVIENVSFAYQDVPVLKQVSLSVPSHQKVAIVGPSGSGKSTLIHVMEGLYDVTEGEIRVGDRSLNETALQTWRSLFSVVSQSGGIFTGTIRENLQLVRTSLTNQQIETVLHQVNLWKDIQKMPEGIDTFVGERGKLLSGGQKQRLQIARALLNEAPFVIFDEATANLDADTESFINQTMNELLKTKTLMVIAHRLSTIQDANCIYFLDNGEVTGRGTHQELYQTHERYRQFVDEQMIG